jgi:hypothetical protein
MIDSHAQVLLRVATVLLTGHMMTRPSLAGYCLLSATLRVAWCMLGKQRREPHHDRARAPSCLENGP